MAIVHVLIAPACGVALGIGLAFAVIAIAAKCGAYWRLRNARRAERAAADRYIAWARGEQERGRAEIARLRHTAEAYGLHVPPPGATDDGDDNTRETKGA